LLVLGFSLLVNLLRAPLLIWNETVQSVTRGAGQKQIGADQLQCQEQNKEQQRVFNEQLKAQTDRASQLQKQLDDKQKAFALEEKSFLNEARHLGKSRPGLVTGLRFIPQAIPSNNADFPFGLKVVVQTDKPLAAPISAAVICDAPIGTGGAAFSRIAVARSGIPTNPNAYVFELQSPNMEPEDTITFRLFSKTSLRIRAVDIH
jgi:hypothetical protein